MQDNAENYDLTINIQATEIDHKYFINPIIQVNSQLKSKLVRKSQIIFVLQLRSGVDQIKLKHIQNCLLESCEQIMDQQLKGITFVINRKTYHVTNPTFNAVKQIILNILKVSQEDDYCETLREVRHAVEKVADRLHQTNISLIFLMTYVQIDHSLGVKKRSYIDHLNQHSEKCTDEVQRLSKTIKKYTEECKTFIISLDKQGLEAQNYSMADTQLMNQINLMVGRYGSIIKRNNSLIQLKQAFQQITAILLTQIYSLALSLPLQQPTKQKPNFQMILYCSDFKSFQNNKYTFVRKQLLNIQRIMSKQQIVIGKIDYLKEKIGEITSKLNVQMKQFDQIQELEMRMLMYNEQTSQINWTLSNQIVSYKLKFQLNKPYWVMNINQKLLHELKEQIDMIYQFSKQFYEEIMKSDKYANRHRLFDLYSNLKRNIDLIQQILMSIFKKKIGGYEIGQLSQALNFGSIKNALKNKLIRRINGNPYLLDQVYKNVKQIVDGGTIDYLLLQSQSQQLRYNLGNCIVSDYNFVKSMKQYDALGIVFQIQRPESAIVDPGRIRIRQVSPNLMRTSKFFEKFMYKIDMIPQIVQKVFQYSQQAYSYADHFRYHRYTKKSVETVQYLNQIKKVQNIQWNTNPGQQNSRDNFGYYGDQYKGQTSSINYLRDVTGLQKNNYSERCDHSDRVNRKQTTLGFMPLFLTKDHWSIAKLLMKPCLGWTASGEPLGYLFSQYQTIPFIVLSSLIKTTKQMQYQLDQEYKNTAKVSSQKQLNMLQSKINIFKKRLRRMNRILDAVEQTCLHIVKELSSQKYQQKLIQRVYSQYISYSRPINRTVDVISNNSCFLSQIYCIFKYKLVGLPKEEQFHQFFIRLVQEQLRRETDGWNQQQTQDLFIDKLLNVSAGKISKTSYNIVGGQQYYYNFLQALKGNQVQKSHVQLHKKELQLMLKKEGKFNDNQRMLLIQYKRLYENRVVWFWYVRFKLYQEIDRKLIHKWKCINLSNSYMLFTMIIQNKKQRKNHKRRQAIQDQNYTDPFNYQLKKKYLETQFVMLRSKKQAELVKNINNQIYNNAASIFCMTNSLEQAAGTLLNLKIGANAAIIYDQLAQGKTILLNEKLKMLLLGKYREVYLFQGWKMSRKRFSDLREIYPTQFMRFQYMF